MLFHTLKTIVLVSAVAGAQGTRDMTVEVCDIVKDPSKWNGKKVRVRGYVENGLRSNFCSGSLVTEGFKWPAAVNLVAVEGISSKKGAARTLGELYEMLEATDGYPSESRVYATVVGQIRARDRYFRVKTHYGFLGNGFGHLGFFPAEIIVEEVVHIETVRSKTRASRSEVGPLP
jgi:hypothetical protein